MSLYETLKAAKIGAAPDVFTTLRAQIAPFAKGGSAPTEKELEDTPPLSFTGNGEPLIDWNISGKSGGVGNKTKNIYNTAETVWANATKNDSGESSTSYTSHYTTNFTIVEENTTYYIVGLLGSSEYAHRIYYYNNNKEWIGRSSALLYNERTFTTPPNCAYIQIQVTVNVVNTNSWCIYVGDNEKAYEPYGYKIPVTCGGETKTIYLDEPLGASDSISMTDTGISIPTVNGSNTLSVGTTVQPSSVYIKYKE